MPEENFFVYEKVINAPVDLIYRSFTSATSLREWLCDISTTDPTEGGRIYLAWNRGYFASGHFTDLIPNKKVAFTWIGKGEPDWTQVEVTISPQEEGEGFTVELRHNEIGKDAEWVEARKEINKGWKMGLENLKATLEDGQDLRVMDRPLIGIYPEDLVYLTDTRKQALNIPVDAGVLVTGVVPDYGAEKAGLQPEDVIVGIEDKQVDGIYSLATIIDEYAPGDQISVHVYRQQEKLTFNVDTMAQKAHVLPATPEELAKGMEEDSSKVLESLEGVLQDVTDAEASYSPGPEEWSVKETLVHLIHNERDIHRWINDLVAGQERVYDEWPGDLLFRIRATLTTYPKVDDLLAELRRSLKETVASVAFLDPEFTRRKTSYWRLATELMGTPRHVMEHVYQIKDNIRAARDAKPE